MMMRLRGDVVCVLLGAAYDLAHKLVVFYNMLAYRNADSRVLGT